MHKVLLYVKRVFHIALYSIRQRIANPRVILVFVLLGILIWDKLSPICTYVELTGVRTNPLIFPFLSNHQLLQKILYAGVIFLYSDAPFINGSQPFVIIRSKRSAWVLGQLLHIIMFSALFFLILMAFSVLILLPCSSFNTDGWGRVINTLAQSNNSVYAGLSFYLDAKIISLYSPLGAFSLCFLLNWGIASFLGMLIFVINLVSNKLLGPIVAAIVVAFDLFVYNALPYYYYHFSPLSLTRLSTLDPTGLSDFPSISYAIAFCAAGIACLSVLSVILVRKMPVDSKAEL